MSDVEVDPVRVVHVDDDPEIVDLAATFLEREDDRLEVVGATTAAEALDRVREESVHCVITDYQLPDEGPTEFLDQLHDLAPGLPVILFTGRDRAQLDDDLLDHRVAGYQQKGSGTGQYADLAAAIVEAVANAERLETDGGTSGHRPDSSRPTLSALDGAITESVLSEALDALADGFFVLDSDLELVYWNRRISAATGYDDATIAEMSPADLFEAGDRDRIERALAETVETGRTRVEVAVRTADGATFPASFRCARLTDEDGEVVGVVGIARDVTERVAYQRELERQNERLEEVIGAVSHDLRNPLNVITGRLQLARETGDDEHFDAIERSARGMEGLVQDLVELGRKGHTVTDRQTLSVAELAEASWESLRTDGATLTVDADVTVRGDRERLRNVFRHLFENALEHAGDAVAVRVGELAGPDGPAGFFVADDGPGVPAEDRERLLEYGETTSVDNDGLGLAVVRRIVEAHGWRLALAESDTGGLRAEVRGVGSELPGR